MIRSGNARLKKPSDMLGGFESGLKKNRKHRDEALNDLEQYFGWFLPLLSSVFVVAIGVGLAQDSAVAASALYFWVALGLFMALFASLLSRFAVFQYWKKKREIVLPLQEWALKMFAEVRQVMDIYVPDWEAIEKRQAGEHIPVTPERAKFISEASDGFLALFTNNLPTAIADGLGLKFTPGDYQGFAQKVNEKIDSFQKLRSGPGAWAMRLFYIGNSLFLLALFLMLMLLAESMFVGGL